MPKKKKDNPEIKWYKHRVWVLEDELRQCNEQNNILSERLHKRRKREEVKD